VRQAAIRDLRRGGRLMGRSQPLHYIWWIVSRSAAVTAMVLISLTVLLGLAMAAKLLRRPRLKRGAVGLHEQCALVGLAAIGVHGLALLGDGWLHPGVTGIAVPFQLSYRPYFTAAGIIAGYLALLLGPSFYLRRRIGARRWRKLHRGTAAVWALAAVHTLGSGSDAGQLWLPAIVLAPVPLLVYLLAVRVLGAGRRSRAPSTRRAPVAGPAGVHDHGRVPVAGSSGVHGHGRVPVAGPAPVHGHGGVGRALELVPEAGLSLRDPAL